MGMTRLYYTNCSSISSNRCRLSSSNSNTWFTNLQSVSTQLMLSHQQVQGTASLHQAACNQAHHQVLVLPFLDQVLHHLRRTARTPSIGPNILVQRFLEHEQLSWLMSKTGSHKVGHKSLIP